MSQPLRTRVNDQDRQAISVLDRGLHYGDGVFRTLRVEQGSPCNWARQMMRLFEDAGRLGLALPDRDWLSREVSAICAGQETAVLKIVLTRGSGGRGYRVSISEPNVILLLYPMPEYPPSCRAAGIQVRICETRLARNPRLAGIKHLNRLEQVLARAEWDDDSIREGLMLDTKGHLVEGVSSNLFLLRNGVLMTPDLSHCGVAGVTREMILEAAPKYTRAVQIRDIQLDDLLAADECMLCNSVRGIWPVTRLDEQRWSVGPVTRKLQQHLDVECRPDL